MNYAKFKREFNVALNLAFAEIECTTISFPRDFKSQKAMLRRHLLPVVKRAMNKIGAIGWESDIP